MAQKFTREEVRAICLAGTQKTAIFFIPLEFSSITITFKISYWHERGNFVAEPGTIQNNVWRPISATAPESMIKSIHDKFATSFGVPSVAGITLLGSVSIAESICTVVSRK